MSVFRHELLEFFEIADAHRATVWATVYTRGSLFRLVAEITLGGQLSLFAAQSFRDHAWGPRFSSVEHRDGIVRTVVRATLAADTNRINNFHYVADCCAANRASRTSDQTDGIFAMVTSSGDEKVLVFLAFTNESRNPAVRTGAASHAVVATCARVQVDNKNAVPFD